MPDDFNLNVVVFFPFSREAASNNSAPYFYMYISFSKFIIPLYHSIKVVQPGTCKEYVNTYNSWLLPHITI